MNEYGSFSKEIAELLEINTNTLRRWSIELEKQGYIFERNEKDQRIYYKHDIIALKKVQHLISERTPASNAFTKVASEFINKKELEQTLSVHDKKGENGVHITLSKNDLGALIEQSVERAIEKEREAMFKAFETKMNDVIEQRDRQLIKQLNHSMEQKRLEIAAAKEEEKKKKGFWARLLGK